MATVAEELIVRIVADDRFSGPFQRIRDALDGFTRDIANVAGAADRAFGGMDVAPASEAINELSVKVAELGERFGHDAYENALHFEDQLTTISRVAHLTADGTARLGEQLKQLGIDLRKPTEDLAHAAEMAARLGIEGDEVIKFVKVVDRFAIGTGSSAADAGVALANIRKIFHTTVGESMVDLERVSSAIIEADQTAGAMASSILAGMRRVSAAIDLGMRPEPVIAMIAVLNSMGIAGEAAGTQINSALTFLVQPKKMEEAARLVGMTAAAFKKELGTDAVAALTKLLNAIHLIKDPVDKVNASTEIFGRIGSKAMSKLSDSTELFGKVLAHTTKAYQENTATSIASERALGTSQASVERLTNAYFALTQEFGARFLPLIKEVANALINIAEYFRGLIKGASDAEISMVALTGAMLIFATLKMSGILNVWGLLSKELFTVNADLLVLSISAKLTALNLAGMGAALKSALLPLAEIMLLLKLFEHLDIVVQGFSNLWYGAGEAISWAGEKLNQFGTWLNSFSKSGSFIKDFFAGMELGFRGFIVGIGAALDQVLKFFAYALAGMATMAAEHLPFGTEFFNKMSDSLRNWANNTPGIFAPAFNKTVNFVEAIISMGFDVIKAGAKSLGDTKIFEMVKSFFTDGKLLRQMAGMTTEFTTLNSAASESAKDIRTFGAALEQMLPGADAPMFKAITAGMAGVVEGAPQVLDKLSAIAAAAAIPGTKLNMFAVAAGAIPGALAATADAIGNLMNNAGAEDYLTGLDRIINQYVKLPSAAEIAAKASEQFSMSLNAQGTALADSAVRMEAVRQALQAIQLQIDNLTATGGDTDQLKNLKGQKATLSAYMDQLAKLTGVTKGVSLHTEQAAKIITDLPKAFNFAKDGAASLSKGLDDAKTKMDAHSKSVQTAVDIYKIKMDAAVKIFEKSLDAWVKASDTQKEQIVGSMNAIAASATAASSAITATMTKWDAPNTVPGMGFDADHLRQQTLNLMAEEIALAQSQKKVNEENLRTLKIRNDFLASGKAIMHKIQVEGVNDAFKALVKSVVEGILVSANETGGDVCCGT